MSFLSDLLGTAYKEGMSEDEISVALEAIHASTTEKHNSEMTKLKTALSKTNSEAAKYKKQLQGLQSEEEVARATMKEDLDRLNAENTELKQTIAISERQAQLLGIGYTPDLAAVTAKAMVEGDLNTVIANQQKFIENKTKEMATNAMKSTPRPPMGDASKGMDYQKMINDAMASGDTASAAYYTRMSYEQNKSE